MPPVRPRRGRPPKYLSNSYDNTADRTFVFAEKTLKEAEKLLADGNLSDSDSMSLRIKVLATLMPLALKRIPDKHEAMQMSINMSEEAMKSMIGLARDNLTLRQSLINELNAKTSDNIVKSTNKDVNNDGQ